MNKDITSYLKVYNNFLDIEQCEQTVKELEEQSDLFSKHQYYTDKLGFHNLNGDKELDISYNNTSTRPYIMQRIWDVYNQYIVKDLDFKWYNAWVGFEPVRFNRYNTDIIMSNHCDHIHSIFDGNKKGVPCVSALGILNDNYTGGELVFWNDQVIKVKTGDMIVFPSNFLYPHRVDPVTSGTRYSFVSWCY
jgi:hypothetical protein